MNTPSNGISQIVSQEENKEIIEDTSETLPQNFVIDMNELENMSNEDREQHVKNMMRMQLLETYQSDPEKIRQAGLKALSDVKQQFSEILQSLGGEPLETEIKKTEVKNETKEIKTEVGIKHPEPVRQEIKMTDESPTNPPTGYLDVPEGLYIWSPDIWNGTPLHCVPDMVMEKDNRPTLITVVLLSPAFGRNREGKIAQLKEGSRCIVHASVAWSPVIPLAKGPKGRPVIWACPTTIDKETRRVRLANKSDTLHKYEVGDGGYEYGLKIMYDPDPKNPSIPRLIDLETLRGASR